MTFTNSVYNFMRNLAQLYLPAAGTLYFGLAGIWGLPYAQQIVGTVVAVDTFLGVVLKISEKTYTPPTDGKLLVDMSNPAKDVYTLSLDSHPQHLIDSGQKVATLAIEQAQTGPTGVVHDE